MLRGGALAAAVVLLAVPSAVRADVPPQPEVSLYYSNITAARVNPLGLVDYATFSLRGRMYVSDSDVATQNFVGIGVVPALSPAWGRLGGIVEIQPLTILRFYAQYVFVGYFGSFDLFASFPSAASDYSDTDIDQQAATPGREAYATFGGELTLGATLQLKLGPIAARSQFRAVHSNYKVERDDRVFYDQIVDTLVPNNGWYLTNDVDVFYLHDFDESFQLALGVRYTYTHAFYNGSHYEPAELALGVPLPDNDIHRLGPIVAFRLDSDPGARFDNPTIMLLAQWHLQHRWRTGADVTVGLPYIALGFLFRGDLLADR